MELQEVDQLTAEELERGRRFGEFLAEQRYSNEERQNFSRIIREFNELYRKLAPQTWQNTKWRGETVLKTPTDLWIYQEIMTRVKPDVVIKTGIHGIGTVQYLRDVLNLVNPRGYVFTVNQVCSNNDTGILFYEGASNRAVEKIKHLCQEHQYERIMVILGDGIEGIDHYVPLVSIGSALIIEDMYVGGMQEYVNEWKQRHPEFVSDYMCEKFMLTFNRDGYFERVK